MELYKLQGFKLFILISLSGVLAFSCVSSGKLVPPGEDIVIMQNESIEAFSLAQKYESKKDYRNAILYYEKSMQYDKLYESAYYKIGRCYALMGEWKAAEDIFSEILIKDKDNASIKDSLGYVYANSGKTNLAEELYYCLQEENPFNSDYAYKYIKLLIVNNKTSEAEKKYTEFKEKFPRNSEEIKNLKSLLK